MFLVAKQLQTTHKMSVPPSVPPSLDDQRNALSQQFWNVHTIIVLYVQDICLFLNNICEIFAQYLYNICTIFVQYLYNICTIFVKHLHNICTLIEKIFTKFVEYRYNIILYFHNICKIFPQYLQNILFIFECYFSQHLYNIRTYLT